MSDFTDDNLYTLFEGIGKRGRERASRELCVQLTPNN